MTSPISLPALLTLIGSSSPTRPWSGEPGDGSSALASLSEATFREVILEEMLRRPGGVAEEPGVAPAEEASLPSQAEASAEPAPAAPARPAALAVSGMPREAEVISREAQLAGIDPALLAALRRVENGGAGREFGVLAVSARSLEEQARVAANTIRKTIGRFERQGGEVVDPATGRYTEGFLRYFSARYAPLGAANDPTGLNRYHAANLIALYRRVSGEPGRT